MKVKARIFFLTLLVLMIAPIWTGNVYASSCPPGSCSVQANSNVPPSDGTIWIQIDNGTYSANTGNYCQTNSCTVPLTQGSPPTFSFGYGTNHTLTVLNANTTFTGQTTQGHYVWKEWDNYYGTSFQTKWTANTHLNFGPVQYNYTGTVGFTAVFDKQYATTLSFTDVNGSPLSPSPASLTLVPQTSGTPVTITGYSGQYVSANNYTVQSAVWEGATIGPATGNEFVNIANGPTSTTIALEAYPATIHITDINNNPVSGANVTVTFVNGTSTIRSYATDHNGDVHLGDVPFPGSFGVIIHYQNQQFGPYSSSVVGAPIVTIQIAASSSSPNTTTTAIVLLAIFGIAFFMILLAIKVRKPAAPPQIGASNP